ncbi:hypothetical protein PENTCL1PPCAC_4141, partial [Pristionchus entomophagus]
AALLMLCTTVAIAAIFTKKNKGKNDCRVPKAKNPYEEVTCRDSMEDELSEKLRDDYIFGGGMHGQTTRAHLQFREKECAGRQNCKTTIGSTEGEGTEGSSDEEQ